MRSILMTYRSGRSINQTKASSWRFVWGPALLALAVIAVESTRTFSAENTSGWLRPAIEAVFGQMRDPAWAVVHHLIRKSGHFVGFGGVCVSFVRAWLWKDLARAAAAVWRIEAGVRGVLCTALVAATDEWHQTFLSNRTGKVADVVLDTCGGIAACAMLWGLFWWRDQRVSTE